jgi:hypothetical protein
MKKLLLLTVTLFTGSAFAASLTMTSNETSEKKSLQPLSQEIIGILHDHAGAFANEGRGSYKIEITNLKCKTGHRGALDPSQPTMMVPTNTCEINGAPLRDNRALVNVLAKIEQATGAVTFIDCAMGKCEVSARAITCHVDTLIKEPRKGRFSCKLTDAR